MPDALRTGGIDGYCVGEPWSSVAVSEGAGRIASVKALIWPRSPEKVLGVAESWAVYNPQALAALLRALHAAAQWCDNPANHDEAAALLARREYLGLPAELIRRALTGLLTLGRNGQHLCAGVLRALRPPRDVSPASTHGLLALCADGAVGACASHPENAELARNSFRPDLYRTALSGLDVDLPANAGEKPALRRSSTARASTRPTCRTTSRANGPMPEIWAKMPR